MSDEDFENWVRTYIERQEMVHKPLGDNDPLFWSVLMFIDLIDEAPELCWRAILAILRCKPNDEALGMLAAGPMEDLIRYHGIEYIEKIEVEAQSNPDLKHLLGGVWRSSTHAVWQRIEAIRVIPY